MDEEKETKKPKNRDVHIRVDDRTKMVLQTLADMKDTSLTDFLITTVQRVYPDWF